MKTISLQESHYFYLSTREAFRTVLKTGVVLIMLFMFPGICMSADKDFRKSDISIDKNQLYRSVQKLTELRPFRNYKNAGSLNRAADFIKAEFMKYGYEPVEQKYFVEGREYRNIMASYGPEAAPRLIIGAHYDVAGEQPGADDNASAVAGLIGIAELFKKHTPAISFRIDFVAYTLEEPPFFRTKNMGSFIHARELHESRAKVLGMVSLEMIGYFSDAPNSQVYPLPLMSFFYPSSANFIAVVGNFASSGLVRHFRNSMKFAAIDVESLRAPSFLIGVDFSDHMNYWKFGYPAIMITDTAFFRNPNYHSESDTIESLNFEKMTEVVKGLYWAMVNFRDR